MPAVPLFPEASPNASDVCIFSVCMSVQRMLVMHTGEEMSSVSDCRYRKAYVKVLLKCGGLGNSNTLPSALKKNN